MRKIYLVIVVILIASMFTPAHASEKQGFFLWTYKHYFYQGELIDFFVTNTGNNPVNLSIFNPWVVKDSGGNIVYRSKPIPKELSTVLKPKMTFPFTWNQKNSGNMTVNPGKYFIEFGGETLKIEVVSLDKFIYQPDIPLTGDFIKYSVENVKSGAFGTIEVSNAKILLPPNIMPPYHFAYQFNNTAYNFIISMLSERFGDGKKISLDNFIRQTGDIDFILGFKNIFPETPDYFEAGRSFSPLLGGNWSMNAKYYGDALSEYVYTFKSLPEGMEFIDPYKGLEDNLRIIFLVASSPLLFETPTGNITAGTGDVKLFISVSNWPSVKETSMFKLAEKLGKNISTSLELNLQIFSSNLRSESVQPISTASAGGGLSLDNRLYMEFPANASTNYANKTLSVKILSPMVDGKAFIDPLISLSGEKPTNPIYTVKIDEDGSIVSVVNETGGEVSPTNATLPTETTPSTSNSTPANPTTPSETNSTSPETTPTTPPASNPETTPIQTATASTHVPIASIAASVIVGAVAGIVVVFILYRRK